ncbi:hypothetical protein [Brevibacillus choshinensis]|nr:hypothetical protein [Brevibacillus choshinensis]MED4583335.1 hypothetical protein [Brevibacillus choshinensis]MED4752620.1 hypothetical protein [Brevibacillus choshinensis]MED4782780.1 hypothetical protein [Brevibacillus choshinensis]
MREGKQNDRPDTSKNGMMKKRELTVSDESIKQRGRAVLNRLGKKDVPKE